MTKSCSTITDITLYYELKRSAFNITCFAKYTLYLSQIKYLK